MTSGKIVYLNDGYCHTRNLILRGVSGIYLIAFVTFYYQSTGLFGNNGILPARILIEGSNYNSESKPLTLLHFSSYLGIDTEYMIDFVALIGIVLSAFGFILQKVCILPTFAVLWTLYYSLIQVSQIFGNQSDYLLLEAGIVILVMAPLTSTKQSGPADKVGFVLLRWMLVRAEAIYYTITTTETDLIFCYIQRYNAIFIWFCFLCVFFLFGSIFSDFSAPVRFYRFMFESGSVKLISNCSYWWNFTAMSRHFEVLPLPNPLSWYSHNLPDSWLKVTNIWTNFTELVTTWFFFFPHRTVRRYLFYWHIYLQFNIIMTGNYGFLNFLMPVLLLSLLDDQYFVGKNIKSFSILLSKLMIIYSILFFVGSYIFASTLQSWKFTEENLALLKSTIKPAPLMVIIIIISTFLQSIMFHPIIMNTKSFFQKVYAVNTLVAFTIISIVLVAVSMVPHGNLDVSTNITNSELGHIYQGFKKHYIVNEYGQHLRKMRSERLEIIYEHSDSIDGPWTQYGFLYKPWNANNSLSFGGPYFARLDHKFYDASGSNYRDQLWTLSIAFRLLQNERNVLALLGEDAVIPAPKFVRASIYKFIFTQYPEKNVYWVRKRRGEYFPAYSLDSLTLVSFLKSMKISPNYKVKSVDNKLLKKLLDLIRNQVHLFEGSFLLFSVLSACVAIIITKNKK